jgi:hypothetical protein
MEVQLPYLCIIDIIGSYKLTQQNNFIIRAPFQIYTHHASYRNGGGGGGHNISIKH